MKTFEQASFWGGQVVYPPQTRQQHLAAFEQLNGAASYDQSATLIHTNVYTTEAGWAIVNFMQYTKQPAEQFPRTFQPFTNIQPQLVSDLRVAPLSNFTDAIALLSNGYR